MSVFPFVSTIVNAPAPDELPVFREYAYDFENNCLIERDGMTYLVEKNEALKIWIYHALQAERFRYIAFSHSYGSEIDTLIGQALSTDISYSEIKRFIVEALMVCPYIIELSSFRFSKNDSGLTVEFDCTTIYGNIEFNTTVKGG